MHTSRVLIAEDHEFLRESLELFLSREEGIVVVGMESTAAGAIEAVTRLRPDVVIVDFDLPEGGGIDLCSAVKATAPATRCLVLTGGQRQVPDEAALAAVDGWFTKSSGFDDVVAAVTGVARAHGGPGPGTGQNGT